MRRRQSLRLPAEELAGEGAHAGRGLARADRAADQDPGVQAQLRKHEPPRRPHFALLDQMVHLTDHHRRGGIGGGGGRPGRERPDDSAATSAGKPHAALTATATDHNPTNATAGAR